MTELDCCAACNVDKCVISGINVCRTRARQVCSRHGPEMPGAFERFERAKRILAVKKAERIADDRRNNRADAVGGRNHRYVADRSRRKTDRTAGQQNLVDRFLKGSDPEVKTFKALMAQRGPDFRLEQIAAGNTVPLPDIDTHTGDTLTLHNQVRAANTLREQGIPAEAIKQVFKGEPVSQAEFDAAAAAKKDLMGDSDFVAKWLEGRQGSGAPDDVARHHRRCWCARRSGIANGHTNNFPKQRWRHVAGRASVNLTGVPSAAETEEEKRKRLLALRSGRKARSIGTSAASAI